IYGLGAPASPLLSGADYPGTRSPLADPRGIGDERAYYYPGTGLLRARRGVDLPQFSWADDGRQLRQQGPSVVVRANVGFTGYFAGPAAHIVDTYGLGEPLLARLPVQAGSTWRIGHFARPVPDGYLETLRTGRNQI